jgi:hypothetical protein
MSGLTNFLAPFSHMLYSNRNIAIVVLCALLAWTSGHLFIARWRHQRLERDLAEARSNTGASARTYATPTRRQVEEQSPESGALPPVKGGRSYARNLGSALSKAGISSPPVYSPPPPPGWVTNANAGQAAPPQPPPAPYAPPPQVPWAAQQQPAAPQWGYPAGPGRPGGPAPSAPPMPFYQPQPAGSQPPIPTGPPASAPGLYAPTGAPGFGPSPFPSTTGGAPPAGPYQVGMPGMPT